MKRFSCIAPVAALCLALLTACALPGDSTLRAVEDVRTRYCALTAFSAHAAVTAVCGERVYEYEADVSGTLETGTLTVTAPENLAGCSVSWDGDGTVLDWEEVTLDTGLLNSDGLTPVDALPAVLHCISTGLLLECCEEADGAELCAELENPDNGGCAAQCWFDAETGNLLRADLTSEGETVVSLRFSEFTMITNTDS